MPDTWIETTRAYEQDAAGYAERSRGREGLARLRARLIALLPPSPFVLDLGSGPGHDAALLSHLGASVVALDPAFGLLREAWGYPEIASRLVCGEACRLPIADSSFEGVWSCASLHHVPHTDAGRALGEVARILKPGGVAFFSISEGDDEGSVQVDEMGLQTRFYYYHHADAWAALLVGAGFELVSHSSNRDSGNFNPGSTGWIETYARRL